MQIPSILFRSVGFVPSNANISEVDYKKEYIAWLKKKPNPIQKMNYLTLGGFVLSIVGAVLGVFSKKDGRALGALLTIVGLGGVGGGIVSAQTLIEEKGATSDDSKTCREGAKKIPKDGSLKDEQTDTNSTSRSRKPGSKGKSETSDLSKLTNDELIEILINKKKDRKNTATRRAEAAFILANRKVEEAIKPLISCLQDKFKTVVNAVIAALGQIGGTEAFEALRKFLKDESVDRPIRIKATTAMRDILRRQGT